MTEPTPIPNILVVDDEAIMIRLLDDMLQDRYSLQFATTGADALSLIFSDPPDLILLDVELPGLNGYEVCRAVRDNPATSDIPVIFLTSNDRQSDLLSATEAGGMDYVCKPFNVMALQERIDAQLRLRKENR
jgi:CheY-like chemotaxis protein